MDLLSAGQSKAESLMRDTCTVTTTAAGGAVDPATGLDAPGSATTVYSGPCRLRMAASYAQTRDVAGDHVYISQPTLSVPVSAASLPVGALVTITGVPSGDVAGHLRLGLHLRVTGRQLGTDMTAQRVTVEAVTG